MPRKSQDAEDEREEPQASLQRREPPEARPVPTRPATVKPGRALVRNVVVDGVAYGPGLATPTPEVEARITNPAAWGE